MPTYTVHAPAGHLRTAQKAELAFEITRAHSEATGAGAFLAQVLFVDVKPGNWYVGGAVAGVPPGQPQIYLHGRLPAGRPPEFKRALLLRLVEVLTNVTGVPKSHVWAYLAELPAGQMAAYGHLLPEPGHEAAWLDALPDGDRALVQSIGS